MEITPEQMAEIVDTISEKVRFPDAVGMWFFASKELDWAEHHIGMEWKVAADYGMFYMSIEERTGNLFKGTMEDMYGLSEFHGTLDDGTIEFTKKYTKKYGSPHPYSDVLYQGKKADDNTYVGTFEFTDPEVNTEHLQGFVIKIKE